MSSPKTEETQKLNIYQSEGPELGKLTLEKQLEIVIEDNKNLLKQLTEVTDIFRAVMFQKCFQCEHEWRLKDVKRMIKSQLINCKFCGLNIQIQ